MGSVSVTGDIRVSHPSPTVVLGNGLDPDNQAISSGTLNINSPVLFELSPAAELVRLATSTSVSTEA